MELSYGLAIPCINPKEVKAGTQTFVHHVHSTIIHNSEKNQATQVFINWWMDKQDVIYTYNGVLFSIKRKEIDTCYNINEPWRHYTSHKREINSSQRTNTLWFHLYEILRLVKFRDQKNRMVVGRGEWGNGESVFSRYRISAGEHEKVW